MVLQPGSGLPVGRGSSPGSQTTQIPGVRTSQMQMMRGHLGNQFTEQGVHPVHQFPQPYGSQQMAPVAFGQEQMRSATPRGEETASLTRYAQFQQVGIRVLVDSIHISNLIKPKKLQNVLLGQCSFHGGRRQPKADCVARTNRCLAFHHFMLLLPYFYNQSSKFKHIF